MKVTSSIKGVIEDWRNEEKWNNVWKQVNQFAKEKGIYITVT